MAAAALARREPTRIAHAPVTPHLQPSTAQGDALRDDRRLDPNLASASELVLLPGVGPSLAQRIVDSRAQHGAFRTPADLRRVKGVGEKTLKKFVQFLRFDSEHIEHTAQSDLRLEGRPQLAPGLHEQSGPQVQAHRQRAGP